MDIHLDCGEILPGHRFLITGVRHDGVSDDDLHADFTGHETGRPTEPMVAVTYELRPGLTEDELHAGLYVDAAVELRPARDPKVWGETVAVAEERDGRPGQPTTSGAFGPFACPQETNEISLRLRPIQVRQTGSDGGVINVDAPDLLARVGLTGGTATLDLTRRSARWAPERPA